MRAMVIYESMFGNTRAIAEAIGRGLLPIYRVEVRSAGTLSPEDLQGLDLIVAGGPTHAWGISRASTREGALRQVAVPGSGLRLESGATGAGLRELFEGVNGLGADAAAFDTRIDMSAMVTGRASTKIARVLRRGGCTVVAPPESFLVSKKPTALLEGEEARARAWGATLAALGMVALDHGAR